MKTTFGQIKIGQEFYTGEGMEKCRYKKISKALAAPVEFNWQRYGFSPNDEVEVA